MCFCDFPEEKEKMRKENEKKKVVQATDLVSAYLAIQLRSWY
jgi:hypothetical protein